MLRYVPGKRPLVVAPMPFGLLKLLATSAVVSPLTRPVAVNPLTVFVMPSNAASPERPTITRFALVTLAFVVAWLVTV